jgi:asparagine synthase (glutamine-hydrolysing)
MSSAADDECNQCLWTFQFPSAPSTRYAKQRIFGWYSALPQSVRAHIMEPFLAQRSVGQLPIFRKAASYVEQGRVPLPERLNMYNLLNRLGVDNILTQ